MMRWFVYAMPLSLAACASYAPSPLPPVTALPAAPVPQVLEQRASDIERPFLTPVSVDLADPLSLDGVAALAVVNNPDLVAQRARVGIADAQVFAAGLLPDPNFSIGANKVLSGPDTMLDIAGGLAFDLAALRTRAIRRDAARAQARQVRLDLAWAEWQTSGQARIQAVRIVALDRIVELAKASDTTNRSLLERVSRAAARGDIAADRLQVARLAAFTSSQSLRQAQTDLAAAKSELLSLLGLPPEFDLALQPSTLPPAPPAADVLTKLALENRADLSALRQGYDAREAAVRQAILEQFPNLALSLNGQRDSAGNFLLGPAVDLSLPVWNRNRGAIATERATRFALKAEYEARVFQTRADIAAAEMGIALARERHADAASGIGQIEHFASVSKKAALRGDLSLETAENAQQALRDRKIQIAQAEQDIMEQTIALELLSGTPREAWPQ